MKIAVYERDREVRVGVIEGHTIRDAGTSIHELAPGGKTRPLDEVRLRAPVQHPGKVVCVGLNYRDHAEESGQKVPERPVLFAKFPSALIGPGESIRIPSVTEQVDYEAELAVVIGKRLQAVQASEALEHVLGYACLNDVSARDLQFADGQWVRGKSLDTFCPVGPWIVTKDEIQDPQALGIRCLVNGVTVQDSSTEKMIFSVAELVSFISRGITLEPGDIIATGTPSGVGFARKPPIFLKPGDVVTVEIDAVGSLKNPVEAGAVADVSTGVRVHGA